MRFVLQLLNATLATARLVTGHLLPNLVLVVIVGITIAWYTTGLSHELELAGIRRTGLWVIYSSVSYTLTGTYRWMMGVPLIPAILVADLVLVSLFGRGWRARRWGKKPPEIERATRYFMG